MVQHSSFTITNKNKVNVLKSKVGIFLPISREDAIKNKPDIKEYSAIWDTGATNSVITKKVAEDLGLKPISLTEMCHAGGKSICNVYFINIVLPNNVVIQSVRVTEAVLISSDQIPEDEKCNVLIGMDIISNSDFAVTNLNNRTLFSFRIPSIVDIDFVKEAGKNKPIESMTRAERRRLKFNR